MLRRVKSAHYEYMSKLPQNVEFSSNFLPKLWMLQHRVAAAPSIEKEITSHYIALQHNYRAMLKGPVNQLMIVFFITEFIANETSKIR